MNSYITLAKSAVETNIREGKIISPPPDLPKDFLVRKSGVFVTIENNNQLRGCIGTYLATTKNIAEEIIRNAIAASTQDSRFDPITKEELAHLSYTVYILNPPEQIKNVQDLNPKKYGVLVKFGFKSGLLLPDLEGVDTIEQQLAIACSKAGIYPETDKMAIYRFTVEKHK